MKGNENITTTRRSCSRKKGVIRMTTVDTNNHPNCTPTITGACRDFGKEEEEEEEEEEKKNKKHTHTHTVTEGVKRARVRRRIHGSFWKEGQNAAPSEVRRHFLFHWHHLLLYTKQLKNVVVRDKRK